MNGKPHPGSPQLALDSFLSVEEVSRRFRKSPITDIPRPKRDQRTTPRITESSSLPSEEAEKIVRGRRATKRMSLLSGDIRQPLATSHNLLFWSRSFDRRGFKSPLIFSRQVDRSD
eukprot:TRINITY_DN4284_c0_g1_i1.p1 TRINITY_DN4284_c0_g1~~TRINITY_DN4284_c0_g1_i1.p1  ORF type:complete len:116 (-),score=11.69 TRINITY_DN4284_c0_g1_i1:169-516(-)